LSVFGIRAKDSVRGVMTFDKLTARANFDSSHSAIPAAVRRLSKWEKLLLDDSLVSAFSFCELASGRLLLPPL
jgi:hypothetical protein